LWSLVLHMVKLLSYISQPLAGMFNIVEFITTGRFFFMSRYKKERCVHSLIFIPEWQYI
jgi:hypothetical protein